MNYGELSSQEAASVMLRAAGLSLAEISKLTGMTKERVRQNQIKGLRKLKLYAMSRLELAPTW